jgi:hypothetical protein
MTPTKIKNGCWYAQRGLLAEELGTSSFFTNRNSRSQLGHSRVASQLGDFSIATMPTIRSVLFLLIAGTIAAANSLGYAVSTGLFITNAGAESIPIFYLMLGLFSTPVSVMGSRVLDRYSHIRLLQWLMAIAIVGLSLFRWKLELGILPVYYLIHITIHLLDLLSGVLLWTLLNDYFSLPKLERYTSLIVMAMTVGGAIGGVTIRLISDVISIPNLLFSVVILDATLIAQLMLLERFEKPSDRSTCQSNYVSLRNIKVVIEELSKFPMIALLAISMVLSVMLWGISELQFFTIYSHSFPDQAELTGFLGLMSACASVLEFGVTYFVTRPLIKRWGMRWMNMVYPITTLLSFVGLLMRFQLPSAIVAHLNYDTLYSSIAHPIQNLNYSALPASISGRVRLMIDGWVYPVCQAATGGLLMAQQAALTPAQISLCGVMLSVVFVWVGYLTGNGYQHIESDQ